MPKLKKESIMGSYLATDEEFAAGYWCIKNNIIEYIRDNKNALFSKQES